KPDVQQHAHQDQSHHQRDPLLASAHRDAPLHACRVLTASVQQPGGPNRVSQAALHGIRSYALGLRIAAGTRDAGRRLLNRTGTEQGKWYAARRRLRKRNVAQGGRTRGRGRRSPRSYNGLTEYRPPPVGDGAAARTSRRRRVMSQTTLQGLTAAEVAERVRQ